MQLAQPARPPAHKPYTLPCFRPLTPSKTRQAGTASLLRAPLHQGGPMHALQWRLHAPCSTCSAAPSPTAHHCPQTLRKRALRAIHAAHFLAQDQAQAAAAQLLSTGALHPSTGTLTRSRPNTTLHRRMRCSCAATGHHVRGGRQLRVAHAAVTHHAAAGGACGHHLGGAQVGQLQERRLDAHLLGGSGHMHRNAVAQLRQARGQAGRCSA